MQDQSPQILRLELENTLLKMQQAHMLERERYLVYRRHSKPIEPTGAYVAGNLISGSFLVACAVFLLNTGLWSTEPREPSPELMLVAIALVGLGLFISLRAWLKFKGYRDFGERYESRRQLVIERYENRIKEASCS